MRPMRVENDAKHNSMHSIRSRKLRNTGYTCLFPRSMNRVPHLCCPLLLIGAISLLLIFPLGPSSGDDIVDGNKSLMEFCASKMGENPRNITNIHSKKMKFVAIGDWGLDTDDSQVEENRSDWDVPALLDLAEYMGDYATEEKPFFVVNVGDNFYQQGIQSKDSPRWIRSFENVFFSHALQNIYWYSMLGNHDWKANLDKIESEIEEDTGAGSQIAHTFTTSNVYKRWCLPDYNYSTSFQMNEGLLRGSFSVDLVVFDSQLLVQMDPDEDGNVYNGRNIPSVDKMLTWLEDRLCHSTADWLITASHHFIVSAGGYFGNEQLENSVMKLRVAEILQKCGVDMHLHGHDHVTQLIGLPGGTVQVGIGSAGKTNGKVPMDEIGFTARYTDYLLYYVDTQAAFAAFEITKKELRINFMGSDADDTLFEHVLTHD